MILNLAYVEQSDLKYEKIAFPDSHIHIRFTDLPQLHAARVNSLSIKTRLSTLDDVFILLQAVDAIRSVRSNITLNLTISYLICGRYDRPMDKGDSFDLKIICDLINQQKFASITVYEPHSSVTTALLRAKTVHPLDEAVKAEVERYPKDATCLVAPDLGAVKRVEDFAKTLSFEIPIVYCHKDRNILTGEIKGIKILNAECLCDHVVVYDDLCDGGRTFIELANAIDNVVSGIDKVLAVTHGIFSKGWPPVLAYYDKIITSNSYRDYPHGGTTRVNITKVI